MKTLITSFVFVLLFSFATPAFAQQQASFVDCAADPNSIGCNYQANYIPMIQIPGLSQVGGQGTIGAYVNTLYGAAIIVAALIAVIKLVLAGAQYMMSDVVTKKQSAIADIQGGVLGLIIIITAILILQTINPNLTRVDLAVQRLTINQDSGITALLDTGGTTNNTTNNSYMNNLGTWAQQCTADPTTTLSCDTAGSCYCVPVATSAPAPTTPSCPSGQTWICMYNYCGCG